MGAVYHSGAARTIGGAGRLRVILMREDAMLECACDVTCPVCAVENTVLVDVTAGAAQALVIDCERCCRSMTVRVELQGDQVVAVDVESTE